MIHQDDEIKLTITGGALQVIFGALHEAGPFKLVAPVIETIRAQVLAYDPTAFDPPPRINGIASDAPPN
jgi:hypothetical protein